MSKNKFGDYLGMLSILTITVNLIIFFTQRGAKRRYLFLYRRFWHALLYRHCFSYIIFMAFQKSHFFRHRTAWEQYHSYIHLFLTPGSGNKRAVKALCG